MKKLVFVFLFVLASCTITSNVVKEPDSEIYVYFCPRDMCKERLFDLIDSSDEIKCAFYDLDLPDLIIKLKEKNAVVIIEDSNRLDDFYSGYSAALMHNKFCIFDNSIVFTGSMNPTERGNYYNNNNILIIRSNYLAQNYIDEFNELKNNIYGKGSTVKNPVIQLGNTIVENYFCPEDNCKLRVINALKKANESIHFMTYSFTDKDIGNLLWNKRYLGLDVRGIFEERQISDYSRFEDLKEFSVTDSNKYTMHHKVFIIDSRTVITGSYNPTANANERNDENLLIIHNEQIAGQFAKEFNYLWDIDYGIIPDTADELVISSVLYNAVGNDRDKEYVILKNTEKTNIILDYYSLSNNKSNKRLKGILEPDSVINVSPEFSLRNKEGILILLHNQLPIDIVKWEGVWDIKAEEGEPLVRIHKDIDASSWEIAK
ncbi:hypothetical protein JW930_03395 [Candidatus Woesearchaeota archaeon]|nr:hypothetical protein [Candidatus Woesearchaeota archaeon]